MVSFIADPRIAQSQAQRQAMMAQALTPYQLPRNPYGGSPVAGNLQRLAAALGARWAGQEASGLQAQQQEAQAAVLSGVSGAGRARPGPFFQEVDAMGPGALPGTREARTQIRQLADDGSYAPPEISAETARAAGIDPLTLKTLMDDAKRTGKVATQEAIKREALKGFQQAYVDFSTAEGTSEKQAARNIMDQWNVLVDPSGAFATLQARETVLDKRGYEKGLTADERLYQEGLTKEDLERHQSDRRQDREWTLLDNRISRMHAAEIRMEAIRAEGIRAERDRDWAAVDSAERREAELESALAKEGRQFIDLYDEDEKRNVKIRVSEYDIDPSRYGTEASATELSRSWVTVTYKDGTQRNQHLTDSEIQDISEKGDTVDKFVSPSRKFQYLGVYEDNGKIIGEGVFNKWTGEKYIREVTEDGKLIKKPIPPGAEPRTEASLSAGIPNFSQFKKVSDAVIADEIQIRRYSEYMGNQKNANVGVRRLADDLVAYYKTFFNDKSKEMNLTKEELALRILKGQLQGLLGGARVITVGPGVMTEQDARRVLENLGGKVDALQNPEVVAAQISRMFNDKMRDYENNLGFYNYGVQYRYNRRGFEEKESIRGEIDPNLFRKDVYLGAPEVDNLPILPSTATGIFHRMTRQQATDFLSNDDKSATVDELRAAIRVIQGL